MMKKLGKWIGMIFGSIVVLLLAGVGIVYAVSSKHFSDSWDVEVEQLEIHNDDQVLERGKHIAQTRGCTDCHGEKYGGGILMDNAMMGTIAGTNLTSGEGGIGDDYSDTDWIRSIRHGVGPDGKPLIFMPSHEYNILGKRDLTALIAYLKALPAVDNRPPEVSPGPMARFLYVTGSLPMLVPAKLIDHDKERKPAPKVGPTVAYGKYLAEGCRGCHGDGFSGGAIPGMPPDFPPASNLTPHESGVSDWSRDDWEKALTLGETPAGKTMKREYMPWHMTAAMTETERTALWKFFQSLPATPEGNR